MWTKLNDGWQFALFIIGVVLLATVLCVGLTYLNNNGVRISSNNLFISAPPEMELPIEVIGKIIYRGDYIYRRDTIVEFCNMKEAKKEMRKELRVFWKETKQSCK